MELKGKHVGLAVTGSFCTFAKIEQEIRHLKETGAILHPVFSGSVQSTDSRFGDTGQFMDRITSIAEMKPILKIEEAEPIGPKGYLDILLIAPCTGNTLAKLAHGISDTPVTLGAKSMLRSGRPVVIALSTNDGLAASFSNLAALTNRKHYYMVPFAQDDYLKKPSSLQSDFCLIRDTLECALRGRQLGPVLNV